jgi:hypothetical protein
MRTRSIFQGKRENSPSSKGELEGRFSPFQGELEGVVCRFGFHPSGINTGQRQRKRLFQTVFR